jgi:hypothetical protein
MRIRSLLTALALFATTVFAVEIVCTFILIYFLSCSESLTLPPASEPEAEESFDLDPVLAVTGSFPEDNPFGRMSIIMTFLLVTQDTAWAYRRR